MKKHLLLAFLLTILSSTLYSQDSLRQQTVQLIDGSVLKGQILEQGDDYTKIKIISGDVLLLNNNLVFNIGKEQSTKTGLLAPLSALQKRGNYNIIAVGILAGRDAQLEDGLVIGTTLLSFIKGYQINQYLGVGAGVGLDIYDNKFIPLHLDFRGNFNLRNTTMYYTLQAGYSFSDHDFGGDDDTQLKGGLMVYPAIGFKSPIGPKLNFLMELGYRNQWAKREYSWRENHDEIIYQRYSFRIGFDF